MIMVYKVIHGVDVCPLDKFFTVTFTESTRINK